MPHFLPAKAYSCLITILFTLLITSCTPFLGQPDEKITVLMPDTEPSRSAIDCPSPETEKPVKTEPKPVWPTPVCPKLKPLKCPICPAAVIANKPVLGEYERVLVDPPGFRYLARIDTGATSTSIHASNITRFERDGKKWVRFQVNKPSSQKTITLERRLVRRVRIKQAENPRDSRLTVMMTLQIGKIIRQIEVSLTDRSNMRFPVLIGRNFLLDAAVVDVSLRHTAN